MHRCGRLMRPTDVERIYWAILAVCPMHNHVWKRCCREHLNDVDVLNCSPHEHVQVVSWSTLSPICNNQLIGSFITFYEYFLYLCPSICYALCPYAIWGIDKDIANGRNVFNTLINDYSLIYTYRQDIIYGRNAYRNLYNAISEIRHKINYQMAFQSPSAQYPFRN